jgi:isoleucyl-tRNA synthetase
MPKAKKEWINKTIADKWEILIKVKEEISKSLETARQQKIIGHSLDAEVTIAFSDDINDKRKCLSLFQGITTTQNFEADSEFPKLKALCSENKETLKDILIVSELNIIAEPSGTELISVKKSGHAKCERCWHYSPSVGLSKEHPSICARCAEALK